MNGFNIYILPNPFQGTDKDTAEFQDLCMGHGAFVSDSGNDFHLKCCSSEPAPLLHWPLLGPHAPAQPQHLPEDDNVKFNIGNTML